MELNECFEPGFFFWGGGSDFGICYLLIVGRITVADNDTQRHTHTHLVDSSRRGIGPWHRPLPDNHQHSEQTSMPPARFEPTIPAREQPQTPRLRPHGHQDPCRFSDTYCTVISFPTLDTVPSPLFYLSSVCVVFTAYCFFRAVNTVCSEYCMQLLYFNRAVNTVCSEYCMQ